MLIKPSRAPQQQMKGFFFFFLDISPSQLPQPGLVQRLDDTCVSSCPHVLACTVFVICGMALLL